MSLYLIWDTIQKYLKSVERVVENSHCTQKNSVNHFDECGRVATFNHLLRFIQHALVVPF